MALGGGKLASEIVFLLEPKLVWISSSPRVAARPAAVSSPGNLSKLKSPKPYWFRNSEGEAQQSVLS